MNNKINHIFSASDCSSEEVLLLYVSGKLNREQTHAIESHLADCEMCSDYVEGLILLQNPERIKAIVETLNRKIDDVTGKKPVARFPDVRIISAAAAVLVVLLIATFLVWKPFSHNRQAVEVAHQEHLKSEKSPEIVAEESDILSESVVTGKSWQKAAPPITTDMILDDIPTDQKDYRMIHAQTGQGHHQYADNQLPDGGDVGLDETVAVFWDIHDSDSVLEDIESGEQDEEESFTTRITSTGAVAEKSDKVVQTEEIASVPADEGIKMYNEGSYENSVNYFDSLLKINPHHETAQWYFAMSVLKLGRTAEAKNLLKAIAKGSGKYKKQAEKELKKLGE